MISCKSIQRYLLSGLMVLGDVLGGTKLLPEEKSTLELVHVVFRHGDRTTDSSTIYPKDPYKNETYYPYGLGELTDKGKDRAYKLGKTLRRRYDNILGDTYTPEIVTATSSSYHRAEVTLELVLAGLFSGSYQPFSNWPNNMDKLLLSINRCPNFKKFLDEAVSSPETQKELAQHRKLFDYISANTGTIIETYWDAFSIYMCLLSEEEWGLVLPDWTKPVYPEILKYFAIESLHLIASTTDLKRLSVGYLLGKIIQDSKDKANQKLISADTKLFLYFGHDLNIALLTLTLGVFQEEIPPYAAYLAFELHKINEIYGFKIFYENYCCRQPKLLQLPDCAEFCPLDKFISLAEEYLPREDTCGDEMSD